MCCVPALAWSQVGVGDLEMSSDSARMRLYFVPELGGAVTVAAQYQARFDVGLDRSAQSLAEETVALHGGYRHYFDGWGRRSAGVYFGGAMTPQMSDDGGRDRFAFPADPGRPPPLYRLDLGVTFQLRPTSEAFVTWTLATFAETSLLFVRGEPDGRYEEDLYPPHSMGFRGAAGVETGPGVLLHLSPYVFTTSTARVGLEWVFFERVPVVSLMASMRVEFDFALRKN